MRRACLSIAVLVATLGAAQARDEIRLVGSATTLPLIQVVAERFSRASGYPAPALELTGAGTGFRNFCSGIGFEYPDLNLTSRRITSAEYAFCKENGVEQMTEIKIGREVLVIANWGRSRQHDFDKAQLFMALADTVPKGGQLVQNPYTHWDEVDPSLPHVLIQVMGPPQGTISYDALPQLVMEPGCRSFSKIRSLALERQLHVCRTPRSDGAYVQGARDEGVIVRWLQDHPTAFAIVEYALFYANWPVLAGNPVEGVAPTPGHVTEGQYAVSRPIYLYIKGRHVGSVPGLQQLLYEITSDHTIGPQGYLADKGFVALDDRGRNRARDHVLSLRPLSLE